MADAPAPGGVGHVAVQPEVPVTAVDLRIGQANNSPMVAADPARPSFLALANRVDGPDFSCNLHVSSDGGRLWAPAQPVPQLPDGADKCYGPEVAFDRRGMLYYLYVGLHGRGNTPMGAFLTTSSDGGRTFAEPLKVLGPNAFQVRMAVSPAGRLHLVWVQASGDPPIGSMPAFPNPILAAHSDDGGNTFSTPVPVSDPGRRRVMAPAVALGPGQSVHVLYYDLQDDAIDYQGLEGPVWPDTWSLVLASSADGSRFDGHHVVDDGVVPPERVMLIFTMPPPALAADDSGRLYAAWHDARRGDWDVFLRASGDGGSSWSAPMRLSDDPPGSGRHQYLPRLSVAGDGRLDAIFYDRRDDAENLRNRVSYTYSRDGGRSFAPNASLTRESSHSLIGQRYPLVSAQGQVEFGGRLALVSTGSSVVAAWTDTRNALGQADATAGPITQDVFATEVEIPGDDGTSGPPWLLIGSAAALVVLAAGIATLARRHRARGAGPARPTAAASLVSAIALGLPACAAGATPPALPVSAETFDVAMAEHSFAFEGAPRAGRVVLRAHNAGQVEHDLTLVRLPDDFPTSVAEQLQSSTRRAFPTLAYLPARAPGASGSFAVDLVPGRYAVLCFIRDAAGQSHARQGMTAEVVVR